jgi:high frequency lysogenization protein
MIPSVRNRAVALGALFQCCELVRQIAWTGHADPEAFETCVLSVFALDADDVDQVYGGPESIRPGLRVLQLQLAQRAQGRRLEITRYALNVLHLERRLQRSPAIVQTLREGIEKAQAQHRFFGELNASLISSLADLYQSTISELGPRIMVQGDQAHLSNPDNAARIRCLLLAAIRSAVLWRQAGGSRWRLIFGRKRLVEESQQLLTAS